jgi:hypothetical protein
MNIELLDDWEKIVGKERMKIISSQFFNNKLNLEFTSLGKDYAYKKSSILSELENTGNMLIELEKNGILTHEEVLKMVKVSARELISKNIPVAFFKNISLMLDEEEFQDEGEDEWLDRELKHIGEILDSLKPKKKKYE